MSVVRTARAGRQRENGEVTAKRKVAISKAYVLSDMDNYRKKLV